MLLDIFQKKIELFRSLDGINIAKLSKIYISLMATVRRLVGPVWVVLDVACTAHSVLTTE